MDNILNIKDLSISFEVFGGSVQAVRGVSLEIKKGEILALVGESGCGKSVTAQSVMGLNASTAKLTGGTISLGGKDVTGADSKEWETIRGSVAGIVFQDSLTSLNPTMKIGRQITEILRRKGRISRGECKKEAVRLLKLVQIPDAEIRAEQYPHQFSGGMRQRVMIAMALSSRPELLIADEPTTALDVTIQLQILKLIHQICRETDISVLFITHDLSVVANIADSVCVMYAGKIVERGFTEAVFENPGHPYTQGLLKSLSAINNKEKLVSIPGTPPDLFQPPKGCAFAARCQYCMNICKRMEPDMSQIKGTHMVSCWRLHNEFLRRTDTI